MSTAISIPISSNGHAPRLRQSSSNSRKSCHSNGDGESYDEDDASLMSCGSYEGSTELYWDCIRTAVQHHQTIEEERCSKLLEAGFTDEDFNGASPRLMRRQLFSKTCSRDLRVDVTLANKAQKPDYFTPTAQTTPGKRRWLNAIQLAKSQEDPWSQFDLKRSTEEVVRHRYNALKKRWVQDRQYVKMEDEAFNAGAMRDCFRLKKLSSFSQSQDWSRAQNYVSKKYKSDVDRDVYFQDVQLQMDAKLWGEEFNRHNPPKKVDIFQMCIIEFVERADKPLYHLEHFIEGNYIKYNSNSGFVDETARRTPQAFSHFSFERSGHALIVVDVQGVDDLYTDPQIHTIDGSGYGDGNLGPRGMALFFHTHVCNDICKHMTLSTFDMSPSEVDSIQARLSSAHSLRRGTVVRDNIEPVLSPLDPTQLPVWSPGGDSGFGTIAEDDEEDDEEDCPQSCNSSGGAKMLCSQGFVVGRRRRTYSSMSEDSTSKEEEEATRAAFHAALAHKHKSSCVHANLPQCNHSHRKSRTRSDSAGSESSSTSESALGRQRSNSGTIGSALGLIHLEMARCHEIGRYFADMEERPPVDWPAAVFHAEMASKLGVVEGALNLARLYLEMERDMFGNYQCPDPKKGLELMEQAAQLGERSAMIHMAKHYESATGDDWSKAVEYYQRALQREGEADAAGGYDALTDMPSYKLQAKLADLLIRGGPNLAADPEQAAEMYEAAAEEATAKCQGKLAAKYYELSGEAYGLMEEQEEE